LDEWLDSVSSLSCLDLKPGYEEDYHFPQLPEGLRDQRLFAFPAQLRPRNGQPIRQPQPPLAMHNGRRIKPVDIGRMDIICTKCSAKRFPKEADGMTAHKQ
jgi:hypothetical protein